MDRKSASTKIKSIFASYRKANSHDARLLTALSNGKLYELFVLSELVGQLKARGFALRFRGTSIKFKGSPGAIKLGDPHFEVMAPGSNSVAFRIFVDIECDTLGFSIGKVSDYSRRHEIDLVVVLPTSSGYPAHSDVALGVECKAVANFSKGIIKEALGVRRELSYLHRMQPSLLTVAGGSPAVEVPARPPSEFWLAFIDPKGKHYRLSPHAFGIELLHLQP